MDRNSASPVSVSASVSVPPLVPPPGAGPGRPAAPPRARVPRAIRAAAAKLPPWGWLEWLIVIQMCIPGLLFIPGVAGLRVVTRVAIFFTALLAWLAVWRRGRRGPGTHSFPARPWLAACCVWLLMSIVHPTTNSPLSGAAQALMYISVLSPAFWAPAALAGSPQIRRLLVVLFVCNVASAALGVAQVYSPRFNPPYIPMIDGGDELSRGGGMYKAADGRMIIRPCGLSDNPGQAGGAGVVACLIGLCLALEPIAMWKRLACLGLALIGMAAIYYCQIRSAMVMVVFCVMGMTGFLILRRNYRQAVLLGIGLAVMIVGAAAWVVRSVGEVGTKRFFSLVNERPDELYHNRRGVFVQEAFERFMFEYPLGAGLGRYGQAYGYFGTPGPFGSPTGQIWVEVQVPGWIIDGGIPLLVCYVTAMALALADAARITLRTRDRELAYWGAAVCALSLSIASLCLSTCPFLNPMGMPFWLLTAALHAADRRQRAAASASAAPRPRPVARRAAY